MKYQPQVEALVTTFHQFAEAFEALAKAVFLDALGSSVTLEDLRPIDGEAVAHREDIKASTKRIDSAQTLLKASIEAIKARVKPQTQQ